MDAPAPRAQTILKLAQSLGFALCGIAPPQPSPHSGYFRRWITEGKHGEMDYLAKDVDVRLDPRKFVPGARAVIVLADQYECGQPATSTGPRIAAYAQQRDYHRAMKKRMHRLADELRIKWPNHEYRSCVDTAPILEREQALRAGLGWIGKNTMLIHPRKGSFLLLGCIVTTLAVQTNDTLETDHCGSCTRCIDACPTRCLEPYRIDAQRCVSYLTIEHRGAIDPSLHSAIGPWLAGCDVCQEVCPFNERHDVEAPRGNVGLLNPQEILNWTPAQRQAALVNSPLKRITLAMWKRNARIVARNTLDVEPDR